MTAAPLLVHPGHPTTVTAADLMSQRVVTVDPDAPLVAARDLFQRHRFHHLLVTEGRRLVGIVSDRDLLKALSPFLQTMAERGLDADTLKRRVHTIMTRRVVTTPPEATIDAVGARLVKHGISALPVVDAEGSIVGVISWKDILRWMVHSSQGV